MIRIIAAVLLVLSALLTQTASADYTADARKSHYERTHHAAAAGIQGNLRHAKAKKSDASTQPSEVGNECDACSYSWCSPCTQLINYCSFGEAGQCAEGGGTCQARPRVCPMIDDPVCGCDGITHSNACRAAAVGTNVWHEGKCEEGNSCSAANPCQNAETYFCRSPEEGSCGATQQGTCTHYSESEISCIGSWEPVCGCDGKVHSNSCTANYWGGVNVSHRLDPSDEAVLPGGNCEIVEKTTGGSQDSEENERADGLELQL